MSVFRLVALTAITDALKTIAPRAGVHAFDMTQAVFRGRLRYGSNDPETMISIIEDERPRDSVEAPTGGTVAANGWRLLVQGFVADDSANPTDNAYILAAEARRVLVGLQQNRNNLLGLGSKNPCVTDLMIGDPIVRPADEMSDKAYFWIPLTLKLVEDLKNPFT